MLQRREIVLCVVLSIVTCGIYGLYWLYRLNEDSKLAAGDEGAMNGGLVILLSIVTCNIFLIYWWWTMGKRMMTAQQNAGTQAEDRSILYLVLSLLGVGIVNYCLVQNDLNAIADGSSES